MPSVETSRSDSILTVTINRPEARNAVVCVRTGFSAMSNGGSPPKRPYATNTGVAWRCSAAAKLRQACGNSRMAQGGTGRWTILASEEGPGGVLLRQRSDGDFLKENDVVVAMIPEADVAFQRTRTSLRLEAELPGGHGLAFRVIGYFDAVQVDDGVRSVQRDLHGVPLGTGFSGPRQGIGLGIQSAGRVIPRFVGFLGSP